MPFRPATGAGLPAIAASCTAVVATSTAIGMDDPACLEDRRAAGFPALVAEDADGMHERLGAARRAVLRGIGRGFGRRPDLGPMPRILDTPGAPR